MESVRPAIGLFVVFLFTVSLHTGFGGATVWLHLQYPDTIARAYRRFRDQPVRCFWLGTINLIVLGFLAVAMLGNPPFGLLGAALSVLLLAGAFVAAALTHRHFANLFVGDFDHDPEPAMLVRAAFLAWAMTLAFLIGPAVLLTLMARGFGALTLSIADRYRGPREMPFTAEPAPAVAATGASPPPADDFGSLPGPDEAGDSDQSLT